MIGNGGNNNVIVNPEFAIYQLLSVGGDGTGAVSQNVIGTPGVPIKFFIQPPITEKYTLKRMNVEAIDANFNNALQYGALTLANGIRIYVENDSGIIKEYTDGFTIKRNHDWALLSGVDNPVISGAGSDALVIRWTFGNGCSQIVLDGSKNERLVIEIRDDMTGLDEQLAQVQGCRKVL